MYNFQSYTTEQLIYIHSNQVQLTKDERIDLFHELANRRIEIERELVNLGVPASVIRDPQQKLNFKDKVVLLSYIDKLIP
jgi:hypothetical protein